MKVLFVFSVIALAMAQAAPSIWGGWNGWSGHGGWVGHSAVVGPSAGNAVVAGPSGVITSHQGHAAVVAAAPAVVAAGPAVWGWNGGHAWNGVHGHGW